MTAFVVSGKAHSKEWCDCEHCEGHEYGIKIKNTVVDFPVFDRDEIMKLALRKGFAGRNYNEISWDNYDNVSVREETESEFMRRIGAPMLPGLVTA